MISYLSINYRLYKSIEIRQKVKRPFQIYNNSERLTPEKLTGELISALLRVQIVIIFTVKFLTSVTELTRSS